MNTENTKPIRELRAEIKALDKLVKSRKFTYEQYVVAHKWLDLIFDNGTYSKKEQSTCAKCAGKCCYDFGFVHQNNKDKQLYSIVWNEHIYYEDSENDVDEYNNIVCKRKNRIACENKPLLCKLHPIYPSKIHILREECDFTPVIADYHKERKMCADVEVTEWHLQHIKEFFEWLFFFPENRLAYVASMSIDYGTSSVQWTELLQVLFIGHSGTLNKAKL